MKRKIVDLFPFEFLLEIVFLKIAQKQETGDQKLRRFLQRNEPIIDKFVEFYQKQKSIPVRNDG